MTGGKQHTLSGALYHQCIPRTPDTEYRLASSPLSRPYPSPFPVVVERVLFHHCIDLLSLLYGVAAVRTAPLLNGRFTCQLSALHFRPASTALIFYCCHVVSCVRWNAGAGLVYFEARLDRGTIIRLYCLPRAHVVLLPFWGLPLCAAIANPAPAPVSPARSSTCARAATTPGSTPSRCSVHLLLPSAALPLCKVERGNAGFVPFGFGESPNPIYCRLTCIYTTDLRQ